MKKGKLHRIIHDQEAEELRATVGSLNAALRRKEQEIEEMRTKWRPVPIAHEWQPKNPQCALCDEPRDSARHIATDPKVHGVCGDQFTRLDGVTIGCDLRAGHDGMHEHSNGDGLAPLTWAWRQPVQNGAGTVVLKV